MEEAHFIRQMLFTPWLSYVSDKITNTYFLNYMLLQLKQ